MIDPSETEITVYEQQVALALMSALLRSASEDSAVPASPKDLHSVLAFMTAMVLEGDAGLSAPNQFRIVGAYIELVATFTKALRDQHERNGISAMDLAAASDPHTLN